jgi:hypothetical protein
MLRYITASALAIGLLVGSQAAKAAGADSTRVHHLRLGIDASRFIMNAATGRQTYEAAADYDFKRDLSAVLEGGWGRDEVNYDYLKYSSSGSFIRLGIDKSLFTPEAGNDYDKVFVGLRYGLGLMKRGEANYTIYDDYWGPVNGTTPAKNFTAHWLELTGGISMEILHNVYAGWSIRGKWLMNKKAFNDLSPSLIPGYGRGDKATVFDFTIHLFYAIPFGKYPAKTAAKTK